MTAANVFTVSRKIAVALRDFVYPPLCFVCDRRLDEGDERVCSSCWSGFPRVQVGDPTWKELKARFVEGGFVHDFASCYYFEKEGKLQRVIHLLKYQRMTSLGTMLGCDVGRWIAGNRVFSGADCLVPVPLHRLKQRERGYNQSDFLCKGISGITGISVRKDLLQRKKYTQSQTHLNLEERRENVGDAFMVPTDMKSLVKGKTVILVDDVITTGSTINECAKELASVGARSVLAVSVAVAQ